MFYSVFVLGKKGPLARVWLAAHWDKKITKAQILETNIVESVDSILQPKVKLSLRTSSHLLLGIVRIYARKAAYLLQDCQDAAFKIKSAFRPGVVDLPDGKTEAAISAITLPENFDFINDFDLIPEPQLHMEPTTTANLRNITLQDEVSSINIDDPLMMNDHRDWSEIGSIGHGSINIRDNSDSGIERNLSVDHSFDMYDRPTLDDGFGGSLGAAIIDEDVFGMTMPSQEEMAREENGFHDSAAGEESSQNKNGDLSRPGSAMSAHSDAMSYGGPPSVAPSGPPSTPGSPNMLDEVEPFNSLMDHTSAMDNQSIMTDDFASSHNDFNGPAPNTMVLEPLDSQIGGMLERKRKRRKKIGMAIDELKTLSGEEMKAQLSDTSDIVTNLDLAPPNKILMNWKKTGLVDKLFTLSQRNISCTLLTKYFSQNLITTRYEASNDLNDEDALLLNQDVNNDDDYSMINGVRGFQDSMGAIGGHSMLPDLDDLEQDFMPNSMDQFAVPKTPRAPKSPAPPRKKRKTEDKENKEVSKRPRDSKSEKINSYERTDSMQYNDSMHTLQDISSIQEARGSADVRPSSVVHNFSNMEPLLEDSDKEDDDDDGFAFDGNGPMSVEPPEEMLPEETFDQFVERVQTKRSTHLLKRMAHQLEEMDHINLSSITKNNNRKMAAQNFYGLLVLKKQMAVELYQSPDIPYSDIMVKKGLKFDEQLMASA